MVQPPDPMLLFIQLVATSLKPSHCLVGPPSQVAQSGSHLVTDILKLLNPQDSYLINKITRYVIGSLIEGACEDDHDAGSIVVESNIYVLYDFVPLVVALAADLTSLVVPKDREMGYHT